MQRPVEQHGPAAPLSLRLPVILRNKVRPPKSAGTLSPRPRLMPRIEDLQSARLILLKALAGYGKTTLLRQYSQWLAQNDVAVAWLRCDAADNEKTRAVAYIAAAFAELDPDISGDLAPFLSALPPLPTEDILAALINRLEQLNGEIYLIIDDYHTIADEQVHEALFFLLLNLPPHVHCVVASRSLPPWNLAEIEHNGAVHVVDESEIRFSSEEIADYLKTHHNVTLDDDSLKAFHNKTEGWITAIKLAAHSLEKQHSGMLPEAVISGSHRGLVDYLAGSVLERQDEETQTFLLRTAPLDRLCASLCNAVTGANNAQVMLDKLVRENLFLEPLDAKGEWYRYHSLFSEFLNDRLRKNPDLSAHDIHKKASFWFEVNRQPYLAAEHALAAGDEARKESLIEGAILDMVRASQVALAIGWFERLPEAFSANKPNILIPLVWSYLRSRRMQKAQELLEKAKTLLTDRADDLSDEDRKSRDEFLVEIEIAEMDLKRVWEGELPDIKRLAEIREGLQPDWHFLRAFVELETCYVYLSEDKLEAAFAAASDTVIFAKKVPNPFLANIALDELANIRYLQGRLAEAWQYCGQAIDRAHDEAGEPLPVAGRFHLAAAKIYYETNDLEKSRTHLDQAIQLTGLNESQQILSEIEIVAAEHIAAAHGEQAAALRLVEYNNNQLDQGEPQSIDRVRSYQAWFLTGCGDLDAAEGVLSQLSAPVARHRPSPTFAINPFVEIRYLAMCRYLVAAGKADMAVNWLRHLARLAERGGRTRSEIVVNGLMAIAQSSRNQHDDALRHVREMLRLGEQGGFARIIVDLGDDLLGLLDAYRKRLAEAAENEERLKYAERLLGMAKGGQAPVQMAGTAPRKPPSDAQRADGLYDRLTNREHQILELIAQGKKNRDVAIELLIAESSVRWHVRNLYSKLDVHNRTEASAKARALKLIH